MGDSHCGHSRYGENYVLIIHAFIIYAFIIHVFIIHAFIIHALVMRLRLDNSRSP